MRCVLISVKPKWCELIANGKKTIELRKTRPKLETPFKCYIYCTAGTGRNTFNVPVPYEQVLKHYVETGSMECINCLIGNSMVIGEFTCDSILSHCEMANADIAEAQSCIRREKILEYSGGHEVYGWHISDLKIYDKPKDLSEFAVEGDCKCDNCGKCSWLEYGDGYNLEDDCLLPYESLKSLKPIFHPPQSWCYVEAVYKHENQYRD